MSVPPITKMQLRRLLGLKSDAALARYFSISTAAVAQWPEDGQVPERRLLQAMTRSPELFGLMAGRHQTADTASPAEKAA